MAAWRIAAKRRDLPSPGSARRSAKKRSISTESRAASASKLVRPRSIVSSGIERFQPSRLAVGAERDLLDPGLRVPQPRLAVALEALTFLIQRDRGVERRLTLFERAHDLLQPGKRGLEGQLVDLGLGTGHDRFHDPRGPPRKALP